MTVTEGSRDPCLGTQTMVLLNSYLLYLPPIDDSAVRFMCDYIMNYTLYSGLYDLVSMCTLDLCMVITYQTCTSPSVLPASDKCATMHQLCTTIEDCYKRCNTNLCLIHTIPDTTL